MVGSNAGLYPNNAPISHHFDYCDFKYGGSGGKGLVRAENATAQITNCTLQQSSSQGLSFRNSPTKVQYCNISNNSGAGVYHESDPYNNTIIDNNVISYNGGLGISFPSLGYRDLYVTNNKIKGNAGGVSIDQGGGSGSTKIYLQNNLIDSNVTTSTPSAIFIGQGFNISVTGDTITRNVCSNNYIIKTEYGYNPYTNLFQNNYIANNKATNGDLFFFYYYVDYANTTFDFINNTVTNNSATNGSVFYLIGNNAFVPFNMNISSNNIVYNTALRTFYLQTYVGTINNNIIFNNVNYEVYNQNTAGQQMVNAKNNSWNRNRSILDNYVYDFFDNGNLSFVQLDPVGNVVLPLTLLNFSGNRQGNNNLLQWTTSNEIGTKTFMVESSAHGTVFLSIGNVTATGGGVYSFTDASPFTTSTYYRLKMVDADGKFTYSNIIWISKNGTSDIGIYPNPVVRTTTLNIGDNANLIGTQALLTDANGRLVKLFIITHNQEQLGMGMMPVGVYFLKLKDGGTIKIYKQ